MRDRILIIPGLSCLICSAALAQAVPAHLADRIPPPSGPFAVGRSEWYWTDSSRTEPYLPSPAALRELVVFVWYPADAPANGRSAEYIPHIAAIAAAIGDSATAAALGSAHDAILSGLVRSHSFEDAPVARAGRPFPVLVFSHGFGESSLIYAAQLEDLASHGYVVVGIEHPFDAYAVWLAADRVARFASAAWDSARARPNGAVAYQLAQVPLRAADIRFVVDRLFLLARAPAGNRLWKALDLRHVGAFGHSLGGLAAASACRWDSRLRACLNEDADDQGRPFGGGPAAFPLKQSFLFFATGHSIYLSPRSTQPTSSQLTQMRLTRAQYDSITALFQHSQDAALASMPGGSIRIKAEADDFTHRTFIDLKALDAPDSASAARQLLYLGVIRQYVRAFFDGTLRGEYAPLLNREGEIDSLLTIEHFPASGRR